MKYMLLQKTIIYGPIASRRLGRSLGINILSTGAKVCSFNCIYCQYGPTQYPVRDVGAFRDQIPTPAEVAAALTSALKEVPAPDHITFSGNGEPTLHPAFAEIVNLVRGIRTRLAPAARLAVLSNASAVGDGGVRRALAALDVRIMKLDVGSPDLFVAINRPAPGIAYDDIIAGLAGLDDFIVQGCLVGGPRTNADEAAVAAYISTLAKLRPAAVQIYTTDRPVADAGVTKVARTRLAEVAAQLTAVTGIPAAVY